jgi:hypothetical protein
MTNYCTPHIVGHCGTAPESTATGKVSALKEAAKSQDAYIKQTPSATSQNAAAAVVAAAEQISVAKASAQEAAGSKGAATGIMMSVRGGANEGAGLSADYTVAAAVSTRGDSTADSEPALVKASQGKHATSYCYYTVLRTAAARHRWQ